jgi:hypothetical protein
MSTAQKLGMGIIAIGMATALLLPGRQTPQVINAVQNLFSGSLNTAIKG